MPPKFLALVGLGLLVAACADHSASPAAASGNTEGGGAPPTSTSSAPGRGSGTGTLTGTPSSTSSGGGSTSGFSSAATSDGGSSSGSTTSTTAPVQHYEYAFVPSEIDVYDLDNGFQQVKTIPVPDAGTFRGGVASAVTGQLYLSYGSFSGPGGQLSELDLQTDQIVWSVTYSFGIDSMSITPDGKTLYMPTGYYSPGGIWELLDAASGNPTGFIDAGVTGPHNTIVSLDGTKVAMGPGFSNYLVVADTATGAILSQVGPVADGVRPFTINGKATLAFITTTGYLGFYVGDMASGQILFTVPVPGFTSTESSASHGISLSPDETELYLIDYGNNYVHVFDPTGLPGSAPVKVADIKLQTPMTDEGWLQHTRDGRYVLVGDCGDVIDTAKRTIVGNLPALQGTRIFNEVDFQGGRVVFSPQSRNQGGYVTQ
jgi:hypothetical protein